MEETNPPGGVIVPPELVPAIRRLLNPFAPTEADFERLPRLREFKNPMAVVFFGQGYILASGWEDPLVRPMTDEEDLDYNARYNTATSLYDPDHRCVWADVKESS
jgi:hypothetical protein